MFSLIITIVSIALVVALVAATMYHGGDTLTQGRIAADASAFVSGAQQIAGAQVMHISMTSAAATSVSGGVVGTDLVLDKYLASPPVVKGTGWGLDTANKIVTNTVDSAEVCAQVNKTAGVAQAKIDENAVAAADFAGLPYGCISLTKSFNFRY